MLLISTKSKQTNKKKKQKQETKLTPSKLVELKHVESIPIF